MALLAMLVLVGALILIHMARPLFRHRVISSARFFAILPKPQQQRQSLRFGPPRDSRAFRLQLLALCLAVLAVVLHDRDIRGPATESMSVLVLVDTSASMSTRQSGGDRMAAARREVEEQLRMLREREDITGLQVSLAAFDLALRRLSPPGPPEQALSLLNTLEPRALGSDVSLVRTLCERLKEEEPPITHLLVVSDLPAPELDQALPIIWRDIAQPVDNVGFDTIRATRNPLSGAIDDVTVRVTASGTRPERLVVLEQQPGGNEPIRHEANWDENTWSLTLTPQRPGLYRLTLSEGGAYAYDDHVAFAIPEADIIPVDWQLETPFPAYPGWRRQEQGARFRVATTIGDVPGLMIADGYGQKRNNPIWDFREGHPLLQDLNFDALEEQGIVGFPPIDGFEPILRFADGSTLVAWREDPPAIVIPGLPQPGNDNLARLSTTVFFNAVRILMAGGYHEPLYTLTDLDHPQPQGNRLALHPNEGLTFAQRNAGSFTATASTVRGRSPIWLLLFALAVLIFVLERLAAVYGGRAWR